MDWPGTPLQAQKQQWPGKPVTPPAQAWPGVRQAAKAPPDPNAAKLDAASRIPVSGPELDKYKPWSEGGIDKGKPFMSRLGGYLGNKAVGFAKGIWDLGPLGETYPKLASGEIDPLSREGVEWSTNLAGLVAGGEFGGKRVPLAAKATREVPKVEGVRPSVADIQKLKAAETTLPEAPQWPGRKQGEAAVEGELKWPGKLAVRGIAG